MADQVDAPTQSRANDFANQVLTELRGASTPKECEAISQKHAKGFARLQEVAPVRAIHIVNLASMKKREFEMARHRKNKEQADLFG